MNGESIVNTPCWYAIHTHPRQENRAANNLKAWNVETFFPKIRDCNFNEFTGEPSYVTKPLFPRYIFAQFKLGDLYHKVRFTRGVHSVVGFSGTPIPIDEEIITLIQLNIKEDGFVRINEEISPGDKVIVKDGPLKNFTGIFEREMKDADRIRILLETVSYQAHVEIERELVKKVG